MIAALALIMVMPACSSETDEVQSSTEAAVQVQTETVKRIQSATTVNYSGTINSASRVQIATKVMGEIESIPFDIGEEFRKGQSILKINQEQILAQKSQANAALQEAEVGLAHPLYTN